MCCRNPDWMREEVPDHKFDFIDVREFHSASFMTRMQYVWTYILVVKSVLVYISDGYTAIALLASNHWSGQLLQQTSTNGTVINDGDTDTPLVPLSISKWIFTGCIIMTFLLLLWEGRKAKAVIRSRDISYSYTNVMANNYYSLKSYDHFCFFCQINNSKKKKDEFAFFIFFTFKGWKRLVLADGPRQVINGLTLYSFAKAKDFSTTPSDYFNFQSEGAILRAGVLTTMLFTVTIWVGSALLLIVAALMYVPLLCYIRGNLKEYCCHKIDKRIAELMKRKARKRLAKEAALARKEAAGDFSHLRDKKGNMIAAPLAQPTLPSVDFDDDYDDGKSDLGSQVSRGMGFYAGQGYPQQPYGGGYGAPPPFGHPAGGGGYAGSNWGGGGGGYAGSDWGGPPAGYPGRVGTPTGGSMLNRAAYPYASSEPESLASKAYEPSVSSMEPLTAKARAGAGHGGRDGSGGAVDSVYGGTLPVLPSQNGGLHPADLNRAPSYRSDWSGYGGGSAVDREAEAAYGELSKPPYYPGARPDTSMSSHSPATPRGGQYQLPVAGRNALLERTRTNESLGSAGSGGRPHPTRMDSINSSSEVGWRDSSATDGVGLDGYYAAQRGGYR